MLSPPPRVVIVLLQPLPRLADGLELGGRVRVIRASVRMVLQRALAVCALALVPGGRHRHAENIAGVGQPHVNHWKNLRCTQNMSAASAPG